ncbi:MAG: phosphopyruvate hydratase [Anaerolineales bacterium]|nr:phosphopyruvate hydratase [Anaerolineales bacterium]
MATINRLSGLEILDSRGRPTVQVTCELAGGAVGTASVPSGASTGTAEALELRDGDPQRYRGLGCRRAVRHINGELNAALTGRSFEQQHQLDGAMLELDGTPNKSRLGANAILAVSLAFARACAAERGEPLYQYFAGLLGQSLQTLPRPTINLFSGGKHAGEQAPIQDVLIVPASARTIDEALAMTFAVYQAAAELSYRQYGMRALSADEGGLAPPFPSAEAMLSDAVESIRAAGLEPGREIALAVDVASSHFFQQGCYHLGTEPLDSRGMIEQLLNWLDRYPIVSIEDGLAEEDWAHWPELRRRVAGRALVLGDDLLCTNPARIRRAIAVEAADALLLKVNQIGTLTEAAEACQLARSAGWRVTISARSGETEDNWLADLAVGWAGDQIKVGSITQSERLAKYNRLLAIEAETGLPLVNWP